MLFQVSQSGGKLVIANMSDKPLVVKEIKLTYETTVVTPEEKLSVRRISEEIKLDSTLKPNERIEIKPYYMNVTAVSVVYEVEGTVQREDHEL